ncbi:DUF6968 family protein [Roseixanthobacter liquoris]|uniref:DUF6968 family protein n=1 Tax=Roseixanthobacter liquoris TaxID=3119921 RepID=UPI00372D031A
MIAERKLKLRTPDGVVDVPVRIFAPRGTNGAWLCRYEIGWPGELQVKQAGGADSVQALLIALQMIAADIYTSSYHESGALSLLADREGYGFPVVPSMRNILVGDDILYT